MALALICLAGLVVGLVGCREAAKEPQAQPAVESEGEAVSVYVTETRDKYHRVGCATLRKSRQGMSLKDAKAEGYTPCSKCNPPE